MQILHQAPTLERFDDDQLIPCYGFGDISTQDQQVFSFLPEEGSHQGMAELLRHYGELAPHVKLSGPTSFAPLIYKAIETVQKTGQYHILLIVADGQVTRPSHLQAGEYSRQEQQTIDAIVAASHHALSIVMVGVGDGPWEQMIEFDDQLPTRQFDNFQFVNFTEIQAKYGHTESRMEAAFALSALMEIPEQYQAIQAQGLLKPADQPTAALPALPPPTASTSMVLPTPKSVPRSGHPTTNEVAAAKENTPPKTNHRHSSHSKSGSSNSKHGGSSNSCSSSGSSSGSRSPKSNSPKSDSSSAGKSPKRQHKKKAPATSEPPAIFLCPITQDLMEDPVVAADGYTYERQAIQQWLGSHDNSPMTNLALEHKNLIPNHMLRSMITDQVAA